MAEPIGAFYIPDIHVKDFDTEYLNKSVPQAGVHLSTLVIWACKYNIILPVLLYECETWFPTVCEEHRLQVFENSAKEKNI
jgi:hypothetical protein